MSAAPLDIARIRQMSSADLARAVAEADPGDAWLWVRDLRDEALRYYNTDAAQARYIADRALELAELIGEPRALGWGYRIQAESLLYSGRMNESEDAYAEAAAAWRRARETAQLGQLLVGRIHVLSLLGRHADAEKIAREARSHLEEAGDDLYLAKLAINLGNQRFQRDLYADALVEYDRALEILSRIGQRDETVLSLEINRAVALAHLDRDEESLELGRSLEAECEERGLDVLGAQVRMNSAYVHFLRAEFDRALQRMNQATAYFRETDHPAFLAACLLNRAEVSHQLNLHREANELSREAAEVFAGVGLTYDEALAQTQGALAFLALERLRPALRNIQRARRLFDRERNAARSAYIRLVWAEALYKRRRYVDAEKRVEEAIRGFRKLNLPRWEAASSVLLAKLRARRKGRSPVPMLRRMLDRLPQNLYPLQSYRILETLGNILESSGRADEAEQVYLQALDCSEDVRVRIPTEDSKIAFLGDKTYLYDRLLSLELRKETPSLTRLLDTMERSRAQSLWDRLRSPDRYLTGNDSEADNEELERARHRLSWLHTRLSRLELGTKDEREQAVELRGRLAEAENTYSRLLRQHAEDKVADTQTSSRPQLRLLKSDSIEGRLGRSLPPGWGWVSYHVGSDFALAVVVTEDGAHWRRLSDDLGQRVRNLTDRLDFQWGAAALTSLRSPETQSGGRSKPSDAGPMTHLRRSTDVLLEELYNLLWLPIEDLTGSHRHWVVSPHGPVHRVPLHALRAPEGYLVERLDFAVSPSVRVWEEGATPVSATQARQALVAGVPSIKLPAVEGEVKQVSDHLQSLEVTSLLHPTRQDLTDQAPQAEILHLAAHGSLRRDNPAYSFIELADGPFYVHDLVHLQLPASLVVLTACSSARGAAPAGDEWIGLARGFLQAGAGTVVASLWPIQDEPTVELMDEFYEEFKLGVSAPIALGRAMRSLMQERPHPWHWASFAVLGGVRT